VKIQIVPQAEMPGKAIMLHTPNRTYSVSLKTFDFSLALLTAAVLVFILSGCAHYVTTRTQTTNPQTLITNTHEETHASTLLIKGEASQISSTTKDAGGYSRSLKIGKIEGAGDAASIEAIAAGVARGLSAAPGVPTLPAPAAPAPAPTPAPTPAPPVR
jgi:hypothetical protein